MIKGTPKIDAMELTAFKVELPGMRILTRVDLVESANGLIHATVRSEEAHQPGTWSEETVEAVKRLAELIEADLANIHLAGMGPTEDRKGLQLPESGLGENLSGSDAPSV